MGCKRKTQEASVSARLTGPLFYRTARFDIRLKKL